MKTNLSTSGLIILSVVFLQNLITSCNEMDNMQYSNDIKKYIAVDNPTDLISPIVNSTHKIYKVTSYDVRNLLKTLKYSDDAHINVCTKDKDTLLYIVNHSKGWTIIAGDRRINPIIAESAEGSLSNTPINENLSAWIDNYADELRAIRVNDSINEVVAKTRATDVEITENKYTKLWDKISPHKQEGMSKKTKSSVVYKWAVVSNTYCDSETSRTVIPHLIETHWGQGSPWNTKLPIDIRNGNQKCSLGCVAVSFGQIMYYLHYFLGKPTGLYHTILVSSNSIAGETSNIGFSRSNFVSYSTKWDNMALNINGLDTNSVGDFMLDIGNRVNMKYSGNGSSADIKSSSLNAYNIAFTIADYNYQKIKNNLQKSKPVVINAYSKNPNSGHSWIIDGLATLTRHFVTKKHFEYTENWMHESEYYDTFDELRARYNINSEYDYVTEDCGSYTTEYLLMNWGDNGANTDGLFSSEPSEVWTYKQYNYKYNKRMCYDFK